LSDERLELIEELTIAVADRIDEVRRQRRE
jgi:hypothetical protein